MSAYQLQRRLNLCCHRYEPEQIAIPQCNLHRESNSSANNLDSPIEFPNQTTNPSSDDNEAHATDQEEISMCWSRSKVYACDMSIDCRCQSSMAARANTVLTVWHADCGCEYFQVLESWSLVVSFCNQSCFVSFYSPVYIVFDMEYPP